jgi:hypothetical protein
MAGTPLYPIDPREVEISAIRARRRRAKRQQGVQRGAPAL